MVSSSLGDLNNKTLGFNVQDSVSMTTRRATADILPECLIHKILCCLSYEEAAWISIVSKKWLQAWRTHPDLEITLRSRSNMKKVDVIMERYRDQKTPIDRFDFANFSHSREVFPLIDKWLDIALQNGVKHLVYTDSNHETEGEYSNSDTTYSLYPFPIFKFLAGPKSSIREFVLWDCDLMPVSLSTSHAVTNWDSLRTLSLNSVGIDDYMLQALLTSCPLIVNLIINHCTRLKKIELRNLKMIMSLCIMINKYQRVKIHAPTLEELDYSSHSLEELDIVEYQNLKSLKISCTVIADPDRFLEHLISKSQFLENLELVSLSLGRFNICRSQFLKVLKLKDIQIIGEINAPNLVSLEYNGHHIPWLKFAKEASQFKHSSHFILNCRWYTLDVEWFHNLREFLLNSISWSQVTLHISKCKEINLNELQQYHGVAPPQVDILNVYIESSEEYPTVVDALLWSTHPRRLNLSSTVKMTTYFIDRLMQMKDLSHSSSHGSSKPWLNQLKEVKAYDCKNQPMVLRRRELAMRLTERQKIYLLLDW